MELRDFIKNTITNHKKTLFYDLIRETSFHKDLFYQILDNFPIEDEYKKYRKDLIAKFFCVNYIDGDKDIELIKSVNIMFTKNEVKNILGKNIHIVEVENIFGKKQSTSEIIKSFACELNKIKYYDQTKIDNYGEIILAKIIDGDIKINTNNGAGKMFLSVLSERMPSNILALLGRVEPFEFNKMEFDNMKFKSGLWKKSNSVDISFITFCKSYIQLKELKGSDVDALIPGEIIIRQLFLISNNDIQNYGKRIFSQKTEQFKKIHTMCNIDISFAEWFQEKITEKNKEYMDEFQKKYVDELKVFVEQQILEESVHMSKSVNKKVMKM